MRASPASVLHNFPVLAQGNRADDPIAAATLVGLKREVLDELGIDTPHTERDVRWFTFLTSLTPEPGESDRDYALRVVRLYKERWSVETGYRGHEELRGFTHALHYDMRLLQYFLAVILSNVWAMQRWRSGKAWTKRGVAEFLAFALLFALHAEGGCSAPRNSSTHGGRRPCGGAWRRRPENVAPSPGRSGHIRPRGGPRGPLGEPGRGGPVEGCSRP